MIQQGALIGFYPEYCEDDNMRDCDRGRPRPGKRDGENGKFPDLCELPPELSLAVLSHLNATDLCLAACVWQNLANDNILWKR